MAFIDLKPAGKKCAPVSALFDMTVGNLPGVSTVTADFAKGSMRLEFDPAVTSVEEIVKTLQDAGSILGRDWFAA
jgi:cation transport ATPase